MDESQRAEYRLRLAGSIVSGVDHLSPDDAIAALAVAAGWFVAAVEAQTGDDITDGFVDLMCKARHFRIPADEEPDPETEH